MRYALFALLVTVPLALTGWIGWSARHPDASREPSLMAGHGHGHGPHGDGPGHDGHGPKPMASALPSAKDPDQALQDLFSGELGGAKVKEKVALYDDKGLFDYIDGAAPVYIQRSFRKLAAAELASGGSDLTCDVYDMNEAANADSIFQLERSPAAKPVPDFDGAVAGPMSFVFHHGRYYAKLTAFDATAEAALPAVAKALRERME